VLPRSPFLYTAPTNVNAEGEQPFYRFSVVLVWIPGEHGLELTICLLDVVFTDIVT